MINETLHVPWANPMILANSPDARQDHWDFAVINGTLQKGTM